MPEVTVNIYSRSYRLAVSTGEEALIQRCADIVDKQMKAIREGGGDQSGSDRRARGA